MKGRLVVLGEYEDREEAFSEYVHSKKDYRVSSYDYTEEEERILEEMDAIYGQLAE